MRQSESIANLAKALLLFQVKIDKISKDGVNPFFGSSYATLNNILDTIKDPLIESGLVIVQIPCGDNGITTMLIHADSGEYVSNDYFMKPEKNTPQSQGSVVSYQRRYCIQSLLMLSFEEDDDANLATHGKKAPDQPVKKQNNDLPWLNKGTDEWEKAVKFMHSDEADINRIKAKFKLSKETETFLLNRKK